MAKQDSKISQLPSKTTGILDSDIASANPQKKQTQKAKPQELIGGVRASFPWQAATEYFIDDLVMYNNLTAWRSLQDNSTGNVPAENTFWTNEPISTADGITDTPWSAGIFTYVSAKVIYNNAQYYLQETPPFKSTDIAAEITAGNWASAAIALAFTELTDTEASYPAGSAGRPEVVNQTEDGLIAQPLYAQRVEAPYFIEAPVEFNIWGSIFTIAAGQTGNYTTTFSAARARVTILVNTITTGGDITITGTKVGDPDNTPIAGSEIITVDTTAGQSYKTLDSFMEVTGITLGGAITGINYDIGTIAFYQASPTAFSFQGYRLDTKSGSTASDIAIKVTKISVPSAGSKKYSLVILEDFGFDSTINNGNWIDDIRTGPDDRSFTMSSTLAPAGEEMSFIVLDMDTYFTADENNFDSTKDEGILVEFIGKPSGSLTGIDFASLVLLFGV